MPATATALPELEATVIEAPRLSSLPAAPDVPFEFAEIESDEDLAGAERFVAAVRAKKKDIESKFAPAVAKAHEAHKALTNLRTDLLRPFVAADESVSGSILAYRRRREREIAEAREAERRRLAAVAQEEAAARAVELEAAGEHEAAAVVVEVAALAPAPYVPPPAPIGDSGAVSIRENWIGEVTDFAALVAAVAAKKAPLTLLKADESAINRFAKATKGTNPVPGVAFRDKGTLVAKGGKS